MAKKTEKTEKILTFDNPLAVAAGRWVDSRLEQLRAEGYGAGEEDGEEFSSEYVLLSRIAGFPFEDYPDHTVPWHLISHTPMRWDHVFNVVWVIESLRQPTGSSMGKPLVLQPFQILILLCILGPEDPETGFRIVTEGLLTIARKNAKTTLVAAIAMALMILDPEDHGLYGQEIQVGASDRDQAGITHMMCERFFSMDKLLGIEDKFTSVPSRKTLAHLHTMTTLRCLSSDAYRSHGGNPAVVLLDEIAHVPSHRAEEFYSVLTTAFGAQDEPLTLLMSTQAPNDQHFFSQMVDRAKRINEGALEEKSFAGFVFEIPETDAEENEIDPLDPDLWYLANPGLGSICSVKDMRNWAKKAKDMPPLQNRFENLRANRRVSETAALVSRVAWERNRTKFDPLRLKGKRCWAGLDLAETTDLASLVLVFEEGADGRNERSPVLPFYWIPGGGLRERSERDKVPYDVWAKEGLVDAKSHRTIDYGRIAEKLVWCMQRFDLQAVGFDRWRMKSLRMELADLGYEWDDKLDLKFLIEIGQGYKDQSRSVELLEEAVVNEGLAHADHPILKWNIANAVVIRDPAGNRKFEKARSFGRIDGAVALAMALHARDLKRIEELEGRSYLNDPDRVMLI